ncbi:E3 ubiquitin-protein ligase bre1 [Spiromyces aspiralis]|uniref:E3 ubiquitin-protein ligase bre1 n=1 Tax=Spiromyces aspiralis TaxID=68401 RepID=A0ACC1HYX3_9FUNG|nr:E3 ubiquitin-protein ligase bre1 [Spiromyces aspiralis]
MSDRKRPPEKGSSNLSHGSAASTPPFNKKRHTESKLETVPSSKQFEETISQCINIEDLHKFQKEAIWRQMQEYKREADRSLKYAERLEQREQLWVTAIGRFARIWDTIESAIVSMAGHDLPPPPESFNSLIEALLPACDQSMTVPSGEDAIREAHETLVGRLNRLKDAFKKVLQRSIAAQNPADSDAYCQTILRDIARNQASREELAEFKDLVEVYRRRAHDAESQLEVQRERLRTTERRVDRLQSPITCKLTGMSTPAVPQEQTPPTSATELSEAPATSNTQPPDPMNQEQSVNGLSTPGGHQAATDSNKEGEEVVELKVLADQRLKELEEMVEIRTTLRREIDELKLQLSHIPEDRIKDTPICRELEEQNRHLRDTTKRQEAETESLAKELEELRAARRSNLERVINEESQQRRQVESELAKVQQDLMRVRSHRDMIQRELSELKSRVAATDSKLSEHKILADARQERLSILISENRRLRADIAALVGDRMAVQFYMGRKFDETVTITEHLRKRLVATEEQAKALDERLKKLTEACDAQKAADDAISALQQQSVTVERLRKQLCAYESIIGFPCVDDEGRVIVGDESSAKMQTIGDGGAAERQGHHPNGAFPLSSDLVEKLTAQLAEKQAQLDRVNLEREESAQASQLMEEELESLCRLSDELQQQFTSKVEEIAISRQKQITKLVGEKSKYEEKFLALNKERDAIKATIKALRAQSLKQMEALRGSEASERHLRSELVQADKEIAALRRQVNTALQKLDETTRSIQTLEQRNAELQGQLGEVRLVLDERTLAAEKAAHENRQLTKDVMRLRTQLERANAATAASSNAELRRLCDDYKTLLKCTSCKLRFKSHVLQRCMHVFCKQCIDSRIETRQRKCPTCGESFGTGDIKQIFL